MSANGDWYRTAQGGNVPGSALLVPQGSLVDQFGLPIYGPPSATYPMPISLPASYFEISGRIEVTPTVQNSSYVSGNNIGGLVSFTLPRSTSGFIQSIGIQFIGGATTQINAYLFDANPTGSTFTDKSTFTIVAADEAKRINKTGIALTPAAVVGDTVTAAAIDNYAKPFNATSTIWAAFAVTGTFTPASTTDMRVNITFLQNVQ